MRDIGGSLGLERRKAFDGHLGIDFSHDKLFHLHMAHLADSEEAAEEVEIGIFVEYG